MAGFEVSTYGRIWVSTEGGGRAGRRRGGGAGQAGEEGLPGEGGLDDGDDAQPAATPGTGEDIDEPWQAAAVALV